MVISCGAKSVRQGNALPDYAARTSADTRPSDAASPSFCTSCLSITSNATGRSASKTNRRGTARSRSTRLLLRKPARSSIVLAGFAGVTSAVGRSSANRRYTRRRVQPIRAEKNMARCFRRNALTLLALTADDDDPGNRTA
jgi:hypothetical protein